MYIRTKDNNVYWSSRCEGAINPKWYYIHGGNRNKTIYSRDVLAIYTTYTAALPYIREAKNLNEDYTFKDNLPRWNWDQLKYDGK